MSKITITDETVTLEGFTLEGDLHLETGGRPVRFIGCSLQHVTLTNKEGAPLPPGIFARGIASDPADCGLHQSMIEHNMAAITREEAHDRLHPIRMRRR